MDEVDCPGWRGSGCLGDRVHTHGSGGLAVSVLGPPSGPRKGEEYYKLTGGLRRKTVTRLGWSGDVREAVTKSSPGTEGRRTSSTERGPEGWRSQW